MEDSCSRAMFHTGRCVGCQEDPSHRVNLKEIRHLVWLSRLIIGILLLLCSGLAVVVYKQRQQVSDQHVSPYANYLVTSAEKLQNFGNPSALLTSPDVHSTNSSVPLQWESKLGNARLNNFMYDGDLIVPRDGNYRIYLQITYHNAGAEDFCDEESDSLSFKLYKFGMAYQRDITLVTSHDTVDCRLRSWVKTLYSAATFVLKANDRLKVMASHPKFMFLGEDKIFLGADFIS